MKKIFVDKSIILNEQIIIKDKLFFHLGNSLRVKINDTFIIGDLDNKEFIGKISSINKNELIITIIDYYKRDLINFPEITLFFSILKGDKNEIILQKCSEIGVTNFIPVVTKNCIINIDNKSYYNKISRWESIVKEACSQSNREKKSVIFPIIRFEELKKYDINTLKIFGDIDSDIKINDIDLKDNKKISIFIGPEGDFTKEEKKQLKENKWNGINISPFILRSETSCIYLSSIIISKFIK